MLTIGEREIFGRKIGERSGLTIESKGVENRANADGNAVARIRHLRVRKLESVIENIHRGVEVGILE